MIIRINLLKRKGAKIESVVKKVEASSWMIIKHRQMTYAGIIWFILAGICFFFPAGLRMAEYGSAFHDAKGGIYSWLAGSIG